MTAVQYRLSGATATEISESIESAVRAGRLNPGDLVPTVRGLAEELQVAPGTVAAAYRAARERGLIETRGRLGTRVRDHPPVTSRSAPQPVRAGVIDLADGQPSRDLLPVLEPAMFSGWAGAAAAPADLLLPRLSEPARERLRADGVDAEFFTVASGGLDAIRRLLAAHLRTGDVVAVEDPGWSNVLDLLPALGLRSQPVAVDDQGPVPQSLQSAMRAGARAAIITSRAHNPTGAYVTSARAAELRAVLAGHPQTLVIEDDHAAELAGVGLASVAGVTQSWAFVRSLSKPYGPDVRISLVAGDEATIARVEGQLRIGSGWVSTLLQRLALALWTSPAVTAAVVSAARAYDARRSALVEELARRGIEATGATGLNVWVAAADETTATAALLRDGWAVAPGRRFRQASPPGIRVTVSNLAEAEIPRLADEISQALAVPTRPPFSA